MYVYSHGMTPQLFVLFEEALRWDFVTELSILLFFAHSVAAPLRPNMSPVRPTKIVFPQTFLQKEKYRRRIFDPRVCACHPENPRQHCQPSDASIQGPFPRTQENNRGLNKHPCRTPPLIRNDTKWISISIVVFTPPDLAIINALQN